MPLTHILLGCWLYDQDVYHCEKNNTYQFMLNNNETIVLKTMSSGQMKRKQEIKPKDVATTQKTSRILLKLQNKELYSHKRKLKSWNKMLIS